MLDKADGADHVPDLQPAEQDDGVRNAQNGTAGMVVHRRVREPQNLCRQAEILEDDSNQFLGAAPIEIESADHDLIGVVAERRHTLAVEDSPDAEFELIFLVEASSGVELESLVDMDPISDHDLIGVVAERRHTLAVEDSPDAEFELIFFVEASSGVELESLVDMQPPIFLFDRKDGDLRTGGRRQEPGGGPCAIIRAMSGQPRGVCFAFAVFLMGGGAALGQEAVSDLLRQGRQMDLDGQYGEARRLFARALDTPSPPQANVQEKGIESCRE